MGADTGASIHPFGPWEREAEERGRRARRSGFGFSCNPYRYGDGTGRSGAWDFGWNQQNQDMQRRTDHAPLH